MIPSLAWIVILSVLAADDVPSVSLADLPEYRDALERQPDPSTPAQAVTFRDLWEQPESYRGKAVRVEGRVVRRFRQPAVGTYPPLTELCIVGPSQDPLCVVFPTPDEALNAEAARACELGTRVRFEGTFLKTIRYPAGDEPRLAPLVVGPQPPARYEGDPLEGHLPGSPFSVLDWAVGLAVGGLVVVLLVRQVLSRPVRRAAESPDPLGPTPHFTDQPEA